MNIFKRRIRINEKIFFKDPYVLRIEFPGNYSETKAILEFGALHRKAYKSMSGTWGYSNMITEEIRKFSMDELFTDDPHTRFRGYFCFSEELDALQFRLSISDKAQQVTIWPSEAKFTIHEYVETDES